MCGIAGFFCPRHPQPSWWLQSMLDAVKHRGPDGQGTQFITRNAHGLVPAAGEADLVEAALGHARLAIVDLTEDGKEPMANEDQSVWLTFNGEIYNHVELRAQLLALGHHFRSRCDAEVILHGYEQWGSAFFRRLDGMYAFGLLDLRASTLLLCRDAFGIKPLFHASLDTGVAFASELDALLKVLPSPTLDRRGLELFLALGYVPAPRSLVEGVGKIPPGGCVQVDESGMRLVDLRFPPRPAAHRARGDLPATDTHGVIQRSVAAHLMADVEVGTFLSGGIDSAVITAAMVEVHNAPVQAFTIAVDDPDLDESEHARTTAATLGVQHHVRRVQPADALSRLPDILGALDEPLADASILPTRLCAELAREHVKVVLSGDGGDELFGGYSRHRLHVLMRRLSVLGAAAEAGAQRLAALLSGGSLNGAYARAAEVLGLPPLKNPARKIRAAVGGLSEDPAFSYARLFRAGLDEELAVLGLSATPVRDHLIRAAAGYRDADALSLAQAMDLSSHLPGDILTKLDRATMAVGLEGRVPLLCDAVARHAAFLPKDALFKGNQGKRVLRKIVEQRLGPVPAGRAKRGFGLPLSAWLTGPLATWRRDALGSLGTRMFIPSLALDQLQRAHDGGDDKAPLLFALCALEMWLRRRRIRPS